MKLSEAIRQGRQLRPEGRERFVYIENRDMLFSDPWGAACEAAQPGVAHFNWHTKDIVKLNSSMEALRAIQLHYFADYFKMHVRCPLSSQRFIQQGGRIVSQNGKGVLKVYDEGTKSVDLGGVTSECDKVEQMAGMVDHLFYAHRWTTEQVIDVVEWYENMRSLSQFAFTHYQDTNIARAISQRLTQPLSEYPKKAKIQLN